MAIDYTKLPRPISQYTGARVVADDEAGYHVWLAIQGSTYNELLLTTHNWNEAVDAAAEARQYIRAFKRLKGELRD